MPKGNEGLPGYDGEGPESWPVQVTRQASKACMVYSSWSGAGAVSAQRCKMEHEHPDTGSYKPSSEFLSPTNPGLHD